MENNKNNDSRIDTDNLNLKDHLNASFDTSKITVSEDLIARTLKAVKESENQDVKVGQKNEIKKKQFPVRQVASAAAVIVLLLLGMNVLQNGLPSNTKDDARISADNATAESAQNEMFATQDDSSDLNKSNEESTDLNIYSVESTEDSTETEVGTAIDNASSSLTATESPDAALDVQKDGGGVSGSYNGNTFTSLYPFTIEEVKLFTITNKTQDVMSIDVSKAKEFYTILDGFTLTQMDNTISDTWDYKVEIKTSNQTYIILIGNGIQVNEESDTFLYYTIDNSSNLLEQIDLFLK